MSVPLSFEPNQGQLDSTVQYLSRGSGYALFLTPGNVVLNLERQTPQAASVDTLRMSLIAANPQVNAVGLARQAGVVSYFIGNDPKNWRSGIPTYGKVQYSQVYPGVDLVFYGNQRQLEYDFVVAPGADPSRIAWRIDGARASVDAQGNLALRAPHGPATFQKPVLYQMDGNKKTRVEGAFAVAGNQVRFRLGSYDHSRALIIDPVLSYASYLGGKDTDAIGIATGPGGSKLSTSQGIAVDSAGSAYVTGNTLSLDFPTKNPLPNLSAPPAKLPGVTPGEWATAFVTKFSPDGSSVVYSTYLGGNGFDQGYAIAVDSSGSVYVTGMTQSTNFPITAGAYQIVCSPTPGNTGASSAPPGCNQANRSAFVTKLNPTGTGLIYSTFLGGYAYQYATAIAVDSAGRAYIAGNEQVYCSTQYTFQGCFPTTSGAVIGGDKTGGRSPQYAFAAVFDPTGDKLLYSSLFGDLNGIGAAADKGNGGTYATGIAVEANGNFYLIGDTQAGRLPTTAGVIQPDGVPLGPSGTIMTTWRGFVAKFNPVTSASGASLAYATYLGGQTGNTGDYTSGIAIDSASNAYIVGYTNSKDFPVTPGAYQTVCGPNGGTCAAAHVTKLDPLGKTILWSTYVGGGKPGGSDSLFFTGPIQLDGKGNIYIMGQTGTGFPLVNPVEPVGNGGNQQVLVAELDPSGTKLLFSTIVGSNGKNTANPAGLAVDSAGDIYVAGNTFGPDLITTPGAFQTTSSDGACCQKGNGFVAKIAPSAVPTLDEGSLANGMTYIEGGLVPGSWAQVKGTNLASTTRNWDASDFTGLGNSLPTNLSGTHVTVNNLPAAVYYISPTQINFQVPVGVTGTASVQVIANSVVSNTVTAAAVTNSPGILPIIVNGTNYAGGVFFPDGKFVGDPAIGPAFRNARPGDIIQLYASALVPMPAGVLPTPQAVGGVTVTIGTVTVAADAAALVAVGQFQINFKVPPLPAGLYPIWISVNGVTSPSSINSKPPGPVVIPIQQ
ncbi:MAG: SBBP repeat-containing protein [Acidobacteriia bacterium]|nr:SBBP repeat-containing protein [Terriglobia bacterium]